MELLIANVIALILVLASAILCVAILREPHPDTRVIQSDQWDAHDHESEQADA